MKFRVRARTAPSPRIPNLHAMPSIMHLHPEEDAHGPSLKALRTHILRLLGPNTILHKALGPF